MENNKKEESNDKSTVVAVVDKEEIIRSELDSYTNQIAVIQKVPLPDKDTEERKNFERQALDQIINNILLHQDAVKQGIKVAKEEIDSQYHLIVSQIGGQEKMNEILTKTGMTEDHLRKDLERQNIIEKYFDFLKEKNEISAGEEEIKDFYEKEVAPRHPEIKLEKVESQIRQKLERQKLLEPVLEIIKNLRQEAEIKILL